ncbi:hypothetical protein [Bradyrhizobium sp. CCBAU 53340]|uniref:hypothetical protein n=1 Tax=Bradyrhizobium sp. CCBAU 53340 TaxID=1325112 RepID=UPI001FED5C36|nr:hypothetical protein [Bradyrhizobium sp. CCBAU 53340]
MALKPGDVIMTATPEGVGPVQRGQVMKEPRGWAKSGYRSDRFRAETRPARGSFALITVDH